MRPGMACTNPLRHAKLGHKFSPLLLFQLSIEAKLQQLYVILYYTIYYYNSNRQARQCCFSLMFGLVRSLVLV